MALNATIIISVTLDFVKKCSFLISKSVSPREPENYDINIANLDLYIKKRCFYPNMLVGKKFNLHIIDKGQATATFRLVVAVQFFLQFSFDLS
jgi:hypothetical protein